jgi:hypothetical protein
MEAAVVSVIEGVPMRVVRSFAVLSSLWIVACANGPTPSSAVDKLTLDSNTSERVAGRYVDNGRTLRFVFAHSQGCYTASFSGAAQPVLQASSCSDGDVIAIGDRVTLRAPAGTLLGGAAPRWDQVQVTGNIDDARELFANGPLAMAKDLGQALLERGDVDTSVLPAALVSAAHAGAASGARGPVTTASPGTCTSCNAQCLWNFTTCTFNPFIAPFCPIWLSQCQTNCWLTFQCP